MTYRSLILVLVGWLSLILSPIALSQEETLPTEASIQQALEGLKDSKLSPADIKVREELYQSTLIQLNSLKTLQEQQLALQEKLEQAPSRTARAKQELAQLPTVESDKLYQRYAGLPQDELERLISFKNEQILGWKSELGQINSDLIAAQTRPERSQTEIAQNQSREQSLSSEIKKLQRQPNGALSQDRLALKQVELRVVQQSGLLLRQQLAGNATLKEYGLAQRELLNARIERAEQELSALQRAVNERRRTLSEQTVDAAVLSGDRSIDSKLLHEQNERNRQLSDELLETTNRIAKLTQQNMTARQQLDRLGQIEQNLSEQIAILKDSLLLSKVLQQQKNALPLATQLDSNLPDLVADIRLRQFELSQEREALRNPELYVTGLLVAAADEEVSAELKSKLTQLVKARAELLERINTEFSSALNLAVSLQIQQQQIQQTSKNLHKTLDEQLFWIPSSPLLDWDWLKKLPQRLTSQVTAVPWLEAPAAALKSFEKRPGMAAIMTILLAGFFYRRRFILKRLAKVNQEVGQFRKDSVWHTPTALLLNILLAAPVPLVLYLTGVWLQFSPQSPTPALGAAMAQLGIGTFMLHLMSRILKREGMAERHFRWDQTRVASLRVLIKQLAFVLLPLTFVIGLTENSPTSLQDDVIGVIILMVGCALLSFLLGRLMLHTPPLYNSRVLHFIVTLAMILMPLGFIVLIGMGYYYTALQLADRFVFSLFLLIAWSIATGLAERGLRVAANRLGYKRAQAKREAVAGKDTDVKLEVEGRDIQQINQQSMRMIQFGLVVSFGVLMYLLWADLFSLFTYLDEFTLWEYSSGSGDTLSHTPISVRDLLGSLVVVGLTIMLARNLPGLLEMLVLSRLELRQGSAYAITTLLSYCIVAIGLISTFSSLGVSWNKLQWLIAALGVGLGFGLQEIFANFISGLIILFERPVRIGDTVTIGTLSGTVSRIRIRATTITDFDHKEIIVPNKTFVTDQLINWSLSDTVTRLILRYGVAHGSDVELVRKLLLQAAQENERVLDDPEPLLTLMSFSNNALEHELRIHVGELSDRLRATDEVNREVSRLFREHGITIAYHQVDLHLKTSAGLEKVIKDVERLPPQPVEHNPELPQGKPV